MVKPDVKRVIFLNSFTGYDKDREIYYPGTDGFYLFGMGQFIAEEFLKRNYKISFENWRMDLRIRDIMEKEINGIKCRIFPSKRYRFIGEYSNRIIEALKKERTEKDTIFHFIPNHKLSYHLLSRFLKNNKLIATHIGGANPYWSFKKEGEWKSCLFYLLERYFFLKNYTHLISISWAEVEYYKRLNVPVTHMPQFGISRIEEFYIKDKIECRKKLGLPQNKKILLQVGRAYRARGFDWIMDVIENYRNKNEYFLVFVGINKEDEYYEKLKEKNVFILPYLKQIDLPDFYNAADLLYYLPHGEMDLNFAGTSYVPLEAMACGTPVVATTLHHFPDTEVTQVSRIPSSKEEIIPMIEELLNSNISRERCREITLINYSWDKIIEKYWEIYNDKLL